MRYIKLKATNHPFLGVALLSNKHVKKMKATNEQDKQIKTHLHRQQYSGCQRERGRGKVVKDKRC